MRNQRLLLAAGRAKNQQMMMMGECDPYNSQYYRFAQHSGFVPSNSINNQNQLQQQQQQLQGQLGRPIRSGLDNTQQSSQSPHGYQSRQNQQNHLNVSGQHRTLSERLRALQHEEEDYVDLSLMDLQPSQYEMIGPSNHNYTPLEC